MTEPNPTGSGAPTEADPIDERSSRPLAPAAERALAEARARRVESDRKSRKQPRELNGRDGPDPTRYGDWEIKGIASDF